MRRAAAWLGAATLVALRIVQATRSQVYGDDLRVFWQAGRIALHHGDPWVRGFDYLPASLALFAPLGALPYDAARALWLVLGVAVLVGSALWTARATGLPPPLVVAVVFLVFPTASALEFANATVLELPFLLGLTAAVAGERWRRAAVLAAVALVLKPLLLPCLLVFVVRRRFAHLAAVGAVLVVADGAALAVAGHAHGWADQLRASLHAAAADPRSADLGALVARGEVPRWSAVAVGVLVVAAAVVVVARSPRTSAVVAAPLAASYLVGPVCWAHYPLLLVPLALETRRPASLVALALLASPEVVHGRPLTAVPPGPLFALVTAAVLVLLADATAEAVRGWAAPLRVREAR